MNRMNFARARGFDYRMVTGGFAVSVIALLGACGDGSSVMPVTPEMAEAAKEAGGLAGVAGAPVNCPAKVATPAPAAGTPTHDIVGVRPGMTYDEAVNVLRCVDNKFAATLKKENNWGMNHAGVDTRLGFVVEVPLTPEEEEARLKEIRQSYTGGGSGDDPFGVKPGKVRYTASTAGAPGEELVIQFMSEQAFALNALPPVESLKASLIEKYGPPTQQGQAARDYSPVSLTWAYDVAGRPSTDYRCNAASLSEGCGVAIAATIEPDRENFELASKLSVTSVVSEWGYGQLRKAEEDLAAFAAKKRADEVEKAKGAAEAPKL